MAYSCATMEHPYKLSAVLLLAVLAACGSNASPSPGQGAAGAPAVTAPATATTTAVPAVATARPSASSATATPAPTGGTIACGAASCQAGSEVCCDAYGKKTTACKPVAAGANENALLTACGSRDSIIAKACDDSSDCPGEKVCCQTARHGTDVSYSTYECLAASECELPERCTPTASQSACKGKGMTCLKSGICAKSR